MKIKCITIDDEPLALQLIELHIKKIPYLEFCGGFTSPTKALTLLRNGDIDLLFLDINMPDISGIDFLKGLVKPPEIIFVTAYEKFAVEAFELKATDYLLKPVSFKRFLSACERIVEKMNTQALKANNFMFVKSEHNIIKINFDSICYIEGYKDYVKIYTDEKVKPILTINTFKSLEKILPASDFIRIHKSFLISIDKIKSFRNGKVLIKDKHLPISESYKEDFNNRIVSGRM